MTEIISDKDVLENHFDEPLSTAVEVMRESLDKYQRQFIELSPFVCIATADADGQPTISPKGDAPGFVRIVDDTTLVIPDRPGNNKIESFHNLVENPKLALIFMIPGLRETLRVSASAVITTDQEMLDESRVGSRPVRTGLLITISKVYFHCGKAMIRSKLWEEKSKLTREEFPSFAEILKAEAGVEAPEEELETMLKDVYENQLY